MKIEELTLNLETEIKNRKVMTNNLKIYIYYRL